MNFSKQRFECTWFRESKYWSAEGTSLSAKKCLVLFLVVLQSSVLLTIYFNPNFFSPFARFSFFTKGRNCLTPECRFRNISSGNGSQNWFKIRFREDETKRQIEESAKDMWLFLNDQLNKLRKFEKQLSSNSSRSTYKEILKYTSQQVGEYHRVISSELKKLDDDDEWNKWKIEEEKELKKIVQSRLHHLQNPANCRTAPLFFCRCTNPYGFASGIDDIMFCLIRAYLSNKMMILDTSNWHYNIGGWEKMFLPLSDKCSLTDINIPTEIPETVSNGANIRRLLTKLPCDLGPRLLRIHDNPLAWWYAQFIHYVMRPNQHLKGLIDELSEKMDYNGTVVGMLLFWIFENPFSPVINPIDIPQTSLLEAIPYSKLEPSLHIRRTDKVGTEAVSHTVEEYMLHAEDYFRNVELATTKKIIRQVYVATDDPSVTKELKTKYPDYKFFYNADSALLASQQSTRYQNISTWGLVADLFMLAKCNFIVCTFSSGISRLAYELMQALQGPNAALQVHSLDVEYFYAWIPRPRRVALYHHRGLTKDELSFFTDDIIYSPDSDDHLPLYEARDGKTSNGLVTRTNQRTEQKGLVPKYKTRRVYDFDDAQEFLNQDAA